MNAAILPNPLIRYSGVASFGLATIQDIKWNSAAEVSAAEGRVGAY